MFHGHSIEWWLNLSGICFNLVGTIIIAIFGLPQKNYVTNGIQSLGIGVNKDLAASETRLYRRHLLKAYTGLALIFLGFLLQMIGQLLL